MAQEQFRSSRFEERSKGILDRYKSTRVKSPAFQSVLRDETEQLRQVHSSLQILERKEHLLDPVEQILAQPELVDLDLLVRYLSEIIRLAENIGLGLAFTQKYVDQAITVYKTKGNTLSSEDALLELYLAKHKYLRLAQLENIERERALEAAKDFAQSMQKREEGMVKVLIAFAEYYTEISFYEKAIKVCQDCEQILQGNPELKHLYYPKVLANYGMNYFSLLNYRQTRTYLLEARRILEDNLANDQKATNGEIRSERSERTMATVLHYFGRLIRETKGNLQDTIQFYVDADAYQRMCPEELSASAFYHLRLGEVLIAVNQLEEAKYHIAESDRLFSDIHFASSGRVQTALAWAAICEKEGDYERAKKYIEDARADAQEKKFSRGELLCLVTLFWLELGHYHLPSALTIFFQALAPWRSSELGRNGTMKLLSTYLRQVLSTPFKLLFHSPHNILGTAAFNIPLTHCVCPIHRQRAETKNESDTKSYPRKVLTLLSHNAGQDLSCYDELSSLLSTSKADIVFLQEITHEFMKKLHYDLSEPYPYQEYGPTLGEKSVGMGMLSRYPLYNIENFKLIPEELVFQQKVSIEYSGQTITLYNIHLTFPWIRLKRVARFPWLCYPAYDTEIRCKEIKDLLTRIKRQKVPIVLAGDFNFSNRSKEYKWLTESFIDAYYRSGEGRGFTWPVKRTCFTHPFVRIDYLFHSSHFQPYSAHLTRSTASDHLPLFVEIAMEMYDDI